MFCRLFGKRFQILSLGSLSAKVGSVSVAVNFLSPYSWMASQPSQGPPTRLVSVVDLVVVCAQEVNTNKKRKAITSNFFSG